VLPFDAETLQREVGDMLIVVEPFIGGTLAPRVVEALGDRAVWIASLGVRRANLEGYGRPEELDVAAALDIRQLRERLGAFVPR
jgi:hypothetical protein